MQMCKLLNLILLSFVLRIAPFNLVLHQLYRSQGVITSLYASSFRLSNFSPHPNSIQLLFYNS